MHIGALAMCVHVISLLEKAVCWERETLDQVEARQVRKSHLFAWLEQPVRGGTIKYLGSLYHGRVVDFVSGRQT